MDVNFLKTKAKDLRKTILNMCINAKTGHVTSSFSCLDLIIALYHGNLLCVDPKNPKWGKRDRFILSKGQASPALYAVLADMGFFKTKDLNLFAQKGGRFGVHLQWDVPGVEITTGSLGHGFGVAAGIALAAKMNKALFLTVALLGDGECYEGSVWETAMFASHYNLNNLIAIVDRNYLCATDFTENLIELEPIEEKWRSFGWQVQRIDGHSYEDIAQSFKNVRSRKSTLPLVIIADSVKGMGVESMCYDPLWHAVAPQGDEADAAKTCLERWCQNE